MNLASVQKVLSVTKHPNADTLSICTVLGWQCIIKLDQFKENDLVGYIMIDTVVPEKDEFEFLRDKKFRVRTIKLRGELSQGLVIPLPEGKWKEGDDLTDIIGVKKYEKPDNNPIRETKPKRPTKFWPRLKYDFKYHYLYRWFPKLRPKTRSIFPKHLVPITDEERCLSGDTLITTHIGNISIKDICENQIDYLVSSFNESTGSIEFKPIISRSIQEDNDDWYEIKLSSGEKIITTSNHRFYTPEHKQYKEVSQLKVNDKLLLQNG